MNVRQRTVLAIAGALVFLMLAFPPFVVSLPNGASNNKEYDFIFSLPKHGIFTVSVNVETLFPQ